MSSSLVGPALRHAATAARNGKNVLAYQRGGSVVLVLNARIAFGRITGKTFTRQLASAGLARRVVARIMRDFEAFPDLSPEQVLEASALYEEAAWRHACRRAGRRVA